jgi:hypothetical protein
MQDFILNFQFFLRAISLNFIITTIMVFITFPVQFVIVLIKKITRKNFVVILKMIQYYLTTSVIAQLYFEFIDFKINLILLFFLIIFTVYHLNEDIKTDSLLTNNKWDDDKPPLAKPIVLLFTPISLLLAFLFYPFRHNLVTLWVFNATKYLLDLPYVGVLFSIVVLVLWVLSVPTFLLAIYKLFLSKK